MAYLAMIIGIAFLSLFGPYDAYAHIFRIALLAQVGFLIYASFRPAKWKWITLYAANALFFAASFVLLCIGLAGGSNLGIFFFGISAMVYSFILFMFIWARHKRSPAPTEETPEN